MEHTLPALPYAKDALEPYLSSETIDFHYGKHHASYVEKLNSLIKSTEFSDASLENIITKAVAGPLFNNAAQVWNHTFYWNSLSPNGGGEPTGKLLEMINKSFGDFATFKEAFTNSAINNFGSGWTWLIKTTDGSLEIVNTSNAACPLSDGVTPLLTCDVWEHAYYIDYRNARQKYLEAFWNLVNWKFTADNL